MKPKHQRLVLILLGLGCLAGAIAIFSYQLSDSLVFFYSPTDVATKDVPQNAVIRVGGLVKEGSVVKVDALTTTFILTDNAHEFSLSYEGLLPNLFRQGQGIVATGQFEGQLFKAHELLAKHDENYMPPEVADALKRSGQWKEGQTP